MSKFFVKKGMWFSLIAVVLMVFTIGGFVGSHLLRAGAALRQVRTVQLQDPYFDYQSILNEFDEHSIHNDDNGTELVAKKSFDMSIFDELDLVGLNENEETLTVRYELSYLANDDTVLMVVTIEAENEIPVLELVPGLLKYNSRGELDIMFLVDDEFFWLSDMREAGIFDETGLLSSAKALIKKAATTVVAAVSTTIATVVEAVTPKLQDIAPRISPVVNDVLKASSALVYVLQYNHALTTVLAFGGNFSEDKDGIYHANFDSWVSVFGYNDLYDVLLDIGTDMRSAKFSFFDKDKDGKDDYILWAWKGRYLMFGAGAELGIYKRWAYGEDMWVVDRSLAMKMALRLDYNGVNRFDWKPSAAQWWITGFDPSLHLFDITKLKATYTITFNDAEMYTQFKGKWEDKKSSDWTFGTDASRSATLVF